MNLNVGKEVAALQKLSVDQLRDRYVEAFGETTNTRHKQWLMRRIAWRLQAQAEGGLSERARQRAEALANEADLRVTEPKRKPASPAGCRTVSSSLRLEHDERVPLPGAVITRTYKGRDLQVRVLATGFEFEGSVYKSLSAVAKAITGTHCNGFHFFRLGPERGAA